MVDLFDVDAFADTIAQTGASWVCFTTSHGAHYWPGPSEAIDGIMPGRTCKRDLIRDLIDALEKHDIRLMLYYHFGWGPNDNWSEAVGMHEPDPSKWKNFVENHFREVSLRYGEDLVSTGAYIDDCGFIAYQYDAPWEKWAQAIKAGNPNAPIGFSQSWGPSVNPFSELQMTDGGGRKPLPAPEYMFKENGQYEDLFPAFWFHLDGWINKKPYNGAFAASPHYSTQSFIEVFRTMDEANIPVTINLLITSDVTRERPFFNPESIDVMRQVRKAIKGDE